MNRNRNRQEPLSDEVLGAYLDGELDTAERLRVEARLATDPDAAAFVAHGRHLCGAVHRLYDRELERRLPPHHVMLARNLQPERAGGRHRGRFGRVPMAVAAAAVVVVVGAGMLPSGMLPWGTLPWGHVGIGSGEVGIAVAERRAGSAESRVAPVVAVEEDGSPSAGLPADAPDFGAFGYRLVLARLLPARDDRARQFAYEADDGSRLVLYDGPARKGSARNLVLMQEGDRTYLSWRGDSRAYSLIGDLDRDTLLAMGKLVDTSWATKPPPAVAPATAPGPAVPDPGVRPPAGEPTPAGGRAGDGGERT